MEQGNQIQRCNKLARNHPAFASFEYWDSTPSNREFGEAHIVFGQARAEGHHGQPSRISRNTAGSTFPPLTTQHTVPSRKSSGAASTAARLSAPVGSDFTFAKANSSRTASQMCSSKSSTIRAK